MADSIDLTPHLVVTVHTPAGDVPIVANASDPSRAGGQVTIMGVSMPYDVALVFGMPDVQAPGTLVGNATLLAAQVQPYLVLGAVVAAAWLLARRRS